MHNFKGMTLCLIYCSDLGLEIFPGTVGFGWMAEYACPWPEWCLQTVLTQVVIWIGCFQKWIIMIVPYFYLCILRILYNALLAFFHFKLLCACFFWLADGCPLTGLCFILIIYRFVLSGWGFSVTSLSVSIWWMKVTSDWPVSWNLIN